MAGTLVSYPPDAPLEAISGVVTIARAGKVLEEREKFAHYGWNVQGYLQKVVIGDPKSVVGSESFTDEAALSGLESIAHAAEYPEAKFALPVPVALILQWLTNKLLEALLK